MIFYRWKRIDQQPTGWNPDLNDGVRVNIRPFMSVPDIGKKGAGVLRDRPNIDWGKDRGRDVESASWFKIGPKYDGNEGDRINDHHLSLSWKKMLEQSHFKVIRGKQMLNQEIYRRDPAALKLVNEGVANVNDETTSQAMAVLRYELETFVCEGEYERGLEHILETYSRILSNPSNLGFG